MKCLAAEPAVQHRGTCDSVHIEGNVINSMVFQNITSSRAVTTVMLLSRSCTAVGSFIPPPGMPTARVGEGGMERGG